MHQQQHPFHIVELSPWPIISSFALLILVIGAVLFIHHHSSGIYILSVGISSVIYCLYHWWDDVIDEGMKQHHHTNIVRQGLRIGMILLILSEIMFFFAFFFSFFKANLFPVEILEGVWPAKPGVWPGGNIKTFDPWDIPFLNTLILLLSSTTITWAHYSLKENDKDGLVKGLGFTIILGILFTFMQAYEYHHAGFKLHDGIYASNFYLATGFHGLHVIIGTIFLIICYFRAKRGSFEQGKGHLGFQFAEWYWHFVDVVWVFLFTSIYLWGQ